MKILYTLKKLLSVTLCAALIGGAAITVPAVVQDSGSVGLTVNASGIIPPESSYEYEVNSSGGITITKFKDDGTYVGDGSRIGVLDEIDGKTVTSIGYKAFYYCYTLRRISLPYNCIKSIGNNAFEYCINLESIEIPDSVTSIGSYAFSSCSNMTRIDIPESVTSIGYSAFSGCSSLTIYGKHGSYAETYAKNNGIPFVDPNIYIDSISFDKPSIILPKGSSEIVHVIVSPSDATETYTYTISNSSVATVSSYDYRGLEVTAITEGTAIITVKTDSDKTATCTVKVQLESPASDFDYKVTDEGFIAISKYKGNAASVIIPSKIDGKPVTSISTLTFSSCENVTNIYIPDSVTTVEYGAFQNCKNLVSVFIPDSVTNFHYQAFYNCSSLTDINVSENNTCYSSVEGVLFDKTISTLITCPPKKESCSIPDSVTNIGNSAFYGCSSLTSITIPDNVTSIGGYAFYNCSNLTSITIPDSVTSIGDWAFYNCSKLTSITIPDSVTSIGRYAFDGCNSLTSIYVDKNNKEYSSLNGVLYNKSKTELICCPGGIVRCQIPDSVTMISNHAFESCRSLTSITIPDSVTGIGGSAFYCCSSLTSITIPDSVTSIGGSAFYGCSSLTSVTIGNSVTSIGGGAFSGCRDLTSITIPDSVTSIGDYAFQSCSSLTSITIPDSVTSIGEYAFNGCNKLTNITIPDSVTSIGEYAFKDCSSLTTVTIGNSVTSIVEYAFENCSSLTSVTIGNSVTSIGYGAFYYCSSLTSITIPDSVTSIGDSAFSRCRDLTSITIPDSVTSIGDDAFYNTAWYNDQANGDVYAGKVYYKYKGSMPDNTSVVVKPGTKGIADEAFYYCTGLTSITIPDSVTSIGNTAFSGCSSLTSITIPDSVTRIGGSAFSGCTSLTSVDIPNSVTSIGDYAFWNCTSLTSITIPDSVTSIGGSAFSRCTGLTSITIPSSVTSIGYAAFQSCTGLTSITIPGSVTSIGDYAFSGCSNLTIYGKSGSYAETYANNNSIPFVATDIAVTGITLNKISATITKGNSETLTATITPTNATNKTVTWTTSNSSIATVSGGKVTAVAAGTATITAKSNNGKTATCTVTVTNPTVAVTGITLNKTSTTITKGNSETLTATITPSNATNKTVTWTTSNSSIATVSGGKVTAVAAGTATITAKSNNGKTATCTVTVVNPTVAVTGILLNKASATITKGNTETLIATITPSNATNKTVTWTTSNSSIATVSGGKVTAVAAGTATITAKSNNGKTATCTVTVVNPTVAVTGITLNKTSTTITKGNTETLTATITPTNATDKTVTWTTSNSSIATVSAGKVTAVAAGTATITAKSNNGKTATCTVTVTEPTVEVTGITLNKTSTTITKGNSETLTATITPTNATDKTVTWTTSNSSIATVSGGKVTAVAAGTATITAKSNNGKTATCTVTVVNPTVAVTGITLNKTSTTIIKGNTETLTATITPTNATDKTVTWTTSNSSIATVSSGKVTAVAAGTATITAKSNNGKTATCTVTVINPSITSFEWGRDNWSFSNTDYYFKNYNVNSEVMNKMKSDFNLNYSDVYELKQKISQLNYYGWGGSCFGMTVSEIMAKHGDLILSRYGLNNVVNKNTNSGNATSVINFIQTLQSNSRFCQSIRQSPYMSGNYSQSDFIDKLDSVLGNSTEYLKLSYGIKKLNKNTGLYSESGYHAVLAYGIESCSYYSSFTGKTYDRRVLIADPNFLKENKLYNDACLYYRSSDHSWIIPYWNVNNSTNSQLCYWNAGSSLGTKTGNIRNIMKYNSLTDMIDLMADFQVSHYLSGIEVENISGNQTTVNEVPGTGNPNLDYAGGQGSGIASYNNDMADITATGNQNELYSLWNPTSNYELSYAKPSDFNAKMDYDGIVFYTDLTNATYVLYKPNGSVEFRGADSDYDITILTDESESVTDWFAVSVSGEQADNLTFAKTKDGYVLSSPNLKNVTVNAVNDSVEIEARINTDHNKVLIYEKDPTTIGLKVDTDNNGTYETELITDGLTNTSVISKADPRLGENVSISASAVNGTAPYTYAFYYKRSANTKWNVIGTEFGTAKSATFKPTAAADYDIKVVVKDAAGKTAEKLFKLTVVKGLTNTSWINAEKVQIGDDIRVTGGAEGGAGGYRYAFYFKRSANSKWNKIGTEFGTKTYGITIPQAAVGYDMKVIVKDSAGNTAEKIFKVTVVESLPLTNISFLSAYDVPVGKTVTAAGRFVGGARPCKYEFYFKRTANTKWNKLSYGSAAGTYAKFTPTAAANYDIKVIAIDSKGTKASKVMTISAS